MPATSFAAPNGSALALALAQRALSSKQLLVVVARDSHAAHVVEGDLEIFLEDKLRVLHVPDYETLPYDAFSPHPEIISQRIRALNDLSTLKRGVLVVPVSALLQRLSPRRFLTGSTLMIKTGDQLKLDEWRTRLEQAGYRAVAQVGDPGEFAVRGSLLDLYPMGSALPYRIELLDDEVDTLRTFDPETQRTIDKISEIELLPAREFPLSDDAVKGFRSRFRARFPVDLKRVGVYQDLKEGSTPNGIENYLPLFFEQTESLFDYISGDAQWVLLADASHAMEAFLNQVQERFNQRCSDLERPAMEPKELYLTSAEASARLALCALSQIESGRTPGVQLPKLIDSQPAPTITLDRRGESKGEALKRFVQAYPGRVLIACDSAGRREAILELLRGLALDVTVVKAFSAFSTGTQRLSLMVAALDDGFALDQPLLAVLTERQLYGERVRIERKKKRAQRDPDAIIADLTALSLGSPVVHEDHGVGRYQGMQTLDVGGVIGEFLVLEYARGDKLYVPVSQLHLVNRYSGAAPELAPLHSLGGDVWERAKKKALEKVRDVAAELLELYAKREARQKLAHSFDEPAYDTFAQAFAFEETIDQQGAIIQVIKDLTGTRAMDRVVCGDVGFGKTEVALRAAFVVAQGGRQIALLVPTTLLAQQHYQNFRDRLADWPIRVEVLSRFKSGKEIKAALEDLKLGKIDVVIGTHRLLGSDVAFKDLGLVIVDEEQRFGVRQKEQLKQLKAEVDMLTLTATPIPRTLNMAMSGLRDLSLIATPPQHRLAVKTVLSVWDSALIKEALEREISRGGQVYFLHNDVDTIEKTARDVAALYPDARVRVAHGQMPERELESVMLDFYRQRFNVLVSTTIIESGIDIPSANTIIINRADKLGLAQLHQLRGRVGRSHHRAYAYLLVPDMKSISADAKKRLDAITSLEELGAGFTLATHDLEIRGAGELLGEGQSGQIQEVGFTLYTDLLARAVRALKTGEIKDDLDQRRGAEIDLHAPALLPDDYINDIHTRLTLYKRIASAVDQDGLDEHKVELIDRFGLLPEAARSLFALNEIKLKASPLGIRKLDIGAAGGRIQFDPDANFDRAKLIKLIQREPKVFQVAGAERLNFKANTPEVADRVAFAHRLLSQLI